MTEDKARDILISVTPAGDSEWVLVRNTYRKWPRVYITYSLKLLVVDMVRGEFHWMKTEKQNVDTGTLNLYTGG